MAHILEKFKFNNKPTYTTDRGAAYCGDSLNLLPQLPDNSLDLVITVCFAKKKRIRNQAEYVA